MVGDIDWLRSASARLSGRGFTHRSSDYCVNYTMKSSFNLHFCRTAVRVNTLKFILLTVELYEF